MARISAVVLVVLAMLMAGGGGLRPADAQHATDDDVADGARVYRDQCAVCHGPDGNQIAGIDFARGQFRRATNDAELMRIIREGLPSLGMPATNFSEAQAAQVVAYLRSMAAAADAAPVVGDPARGRVVVEGKGDCLSCHRVAGRGSGLGPELTSIGQQRRAGELERALVDPRAEVPPSNRFYRVVTRDGEEVMGRLLNHDTFTVQLLDTQQRLRSFEKATLRDHGFAPSPMPSYRETLTRQELADVVSYLTTLRGPEAP